MIATDTNVLLRYLLRDDDRQAERARKVFQKGAVVLVTDVVLAETVWTLMGRRYRVSKSDVVNVIDQLLMEPNVCFEDDEVVWGALQAYRETTANFADALIVHKALKTAAEMGEALDAVYTFDAAALSLPSTSAP